MMDNVSNKKTVKKPVEATLIKEIPKKEILVEASYTKETPKEIPVKEVPKEIFKEIPVKIVTAEVVVKTEADIAIEVAARRAASIAATGSTWRKS